jgi:hypothetical protein
LKKVFFIFLLAFTSPLYGYQHTEGSTFVFSDALLWKLREGSADNWAQELSPRNIEQQPGKLIDVPFNWDTGFRLGIGYHGQSDWDTVATYTNYHTNATSHATGNVYSAYLGNFFADNTDGIHFGPYYQAASMRWKFLFDSVDLELGRTFHIDSVLTLRPFIGLKTAMINQSMDSHWQNPTLRDPFDPNLTLPANFTSATEELKNNFWGIGPAIGVNTTWPFYTTPKQRLSVFGDVSGALLWGHWSFKDHYQNDAPISIAINNSDITSGATMARGIIGLEWTRYFSAADFTVRLGYEAQVWFNQLQYYSFNVGRLNNLMSLQGGTLDFCLNF